MILLWLMLVLAPPAGALEPPFYLRAASGERDVGGLNENDRALADSVRRTDLTNGGTVSGTLTISGTGNGITFPDGTTQTTAPTAVSITAAQTSSVAFTATLDQRGGSAACFSGSSIAITMNGGVGFDVWLVGGGVNATATASTFCNVLQDGAFLGGKTQTSTTSLWYIAPGIGGTYNYSWRVTFPAASAGSHTYCLTCASGTGAVTIGDQSKATFGITEPAH